MNQNQKKTLFCLFQTAVIVSGIYFYMFYSEIYKDAPYYQILVFIYAFILGLSEFLIALMLFILTRIRIQITSMNMLYRYIRDNCYKEYYALIFINMGFMISFCIIGLVDENTFSFQDLYSYHFIGAFYIQTLLYVCFSKDLLQRRSLVPNEQIFETEGVFRCAYEVIYYILSLLIIITYFMKFQVDQLQQPQNLIGTLIINTTVYMLYTITKIGILVKMFLIITTTRLLYFCIKGISDDNQQTAAIIITILTALFLLRIIQQYYIFQIGLLKALCWQERNTMSPKIMFQLISQLHLIYYHNENLTIMAEQMCVPQVKKIQFSCNQYHLNHNPNHNSKCCVQFVIWDY